MLAADRDAAAAVHCLAAAYSGLAIARWLVPDDTEHEAMLRGYFHAVVAHGLEHGQVWLSPNQSGVAGWTACSWGGTDPRDSDGQLAQAAGKHHSRFRLLDALLAQRHPALGHHHLAWHAVDPNTHGNGIGAALLDDYLTRLDVWRTPAYLVAASQQSWQLYRRRGFLNYGQPLDIPDGPRLYPLWREARSGGLDVVI
jgi:GNAT superfamily N-acetyltransferase